jgi:hypothetical protein
MNLELTDGETAALLRELDGIIGGDRYFMSRRIKTLRAIRSKLRTEPAREPLPPPPSVMNYQGRPQRKDGAEDAEDHSPREGLAAINSK